MIVTSNKYVLKYLRKVTFLPDLVCLGGGVWCSVCCGLINTSNFESDFCFSVTKYLLGKCVVVHTQECVHDCIVLDFYMTYICHELWDIARVFNFSGSIFIWILWSVYTTRSMLNCVDDSLTQKKVIGLHWELTCSVTAPMDVLDASVVSRIFVSQLLSMYNLFIKLLSADLMTLLECKTFVFFSEEDYLVQEVSMNSLVQIFSKN